VNFFAAQDRAKRATRWLIIVYVVATAMIVAGVTLVVGVALYSFSNPGYGGAEFAVRSSPLLIATAIGTTLSIFAASLYKTSVLSTGGGQVAASLGGKLVAADVSDPLRRRLRNVVEEIAIASGVPVPEIYVLEAEGGINAFAAGYTPGDAAIAVTRGALELLERDELQGVIAHEFSHILNGDMRLNIRLMGVLFCIMVLGLVGRMIMRGGYHSSILSVRRERGAPVILVIGLGLAVLGGIGVFFARLIKASVSRQREYLADASAVQFTRQSAGIANALKKIGGYEESSFIKAADPEEVSHMLFGTGARLFGWFATHPPLTQRIKALDPSFNDRNYPVIDRRRPPAVAAESVRPAVASGFATSDVDQVIASSPEAIVATIGNPEKRHIEYAETLRQSIPITLYTAAHSKEFVSLLVIALILDRDNKVLVQQLSLLGERLGRERRQRIEQYREEVALMDRRFWLPLLEVSFPALKMRPASELGFLLDLIRRLIEIDGRTVLFEYCFYRILLCNLEKAVDPTAQRSSSASLKQQRMAALNLLALVADFGHDDQETRDKAFSAGATILGEWARNFAIEPNREQSVKILDLSLDALGRLSNDERQRLIRAITSVASSDGRLRVTETELIRVVCATLDCPLPPILERL
jgi:Zn-dependent protease with chaperone function